MPGRFDNQDGELPFEGSLRSLGQGKKTRRYKCSG